MVVACPPAGRTISHPWTPTTLPLDAWLRLPPPHAFLVSVFFGRGSHPSPALRQALVRWAVNQAKQRGRGRLRWLPWVLGGPGGRNGIAGDEIATITASLWPRGQFGGMPVALQMWRARCVVRTAVLEGGGCPRLALLGGGGSRASRAFARTRGRKFAVATDGVVQRSSGGSWFRWR